MSLSAYGDDKGAASAGPAGMQAPKLRPGGYAAWKPDMDVYLERIGADGVHKRAMTEDSWSKMALQVQSWSDERWRRPWRPSESATEPRRPPRAAAHLRQPS